MLKKIDPYFRIPSRAPFAWLVILIMVAILALLYQITNKNWFVWIVGRAFWVIIIIQLIYNLINVFKGKTPPRRMVINTLLFIALLFVVGYIAEILQIVIPNTILSN